jgi:mRNA interferase RelE/StbE
VAYNELQGQRAQGNGEASQAVRLAVVAKAESLENNPRPVGCAKLAGATNLWRVRVGNYRIVYAISDKDETVEVRIVAHRRDVYRGL